MEFPPASSVQGTFHYIPPNLSALSLTPPSKNTLLWIGGLYDTLLSVSYPQPLSLSLPPSWSLAVSSLSSAGLSWGVGSLTQDAHDISLILSYLKSLHPTGKIIIMGHSTGCQDCMEYILNPAPPSSPDKPSEARVAVDGVILQAPVSDREAITLHIGAEKQSAADGVAMKWCAEGRGEEVLERGVTGEVFPGVPVTARRWVDLSSPGPDHTGKDDMFSSDFRGERLQRTFGRLSPTTPLLVLVGGSDEGVPESVDKEGMVGRWVEAVKEGGGVVDEVHSGVVPRASHNLNGQSEEIRRELIRRVVGFVERLDRGELKR